MNSGKKFKYKFFVGVLIILFVLEGIHTFKNSKNAKEFDNYKSSIIQYTDKLDRDVFGDYETTYQSLLNKSDKMIIKEQTNKINSMKISFEKLETEVEASAPQALEQQYSELISLDTSKLDQDTLTQVNKDIGYVRILIDKKYYRIANHEYNRIKDKVNKVTEAKLKEEQEAARKAAEQAAQAAQSATATPSSNTDVTTTNNETTNVQ